MAKLGAILVLAVAALLGCGEPVEKPALLSQGGRGPLTIRMETGRASAAEYHQPLGWWRRNHMLLVPRSPGEDGAGYDYSLRECLVCHNPRTSCNRCHRYSGVRPVLEDYEAED